MKIKSYINAFFESYLEALFETFNDKSCNVHDFDKDSLQQLKAECIEFIKENEENLINLSPEKAGRDFLKVTNGLAKGFHESKPGDAEKIEKSADGFGPLRLYVGENGKLYAISI